MALGSGNLPEFPSPWSYDHGAVVSSGFPVSDAGRGPVAPVKCAQSPRPPAVDIPMRLLQEGAIEGEAASNTIFSLLFEYRQLYLFTESQSDEQASQIHEAFDFSP